MANVREPQHVFVYGTLRQEGTRPLMHLFPHATPVGAATGLGYLFDLGAYPRLILDPSGSVVVGEIYTVDQEIMLALDAIEGVNAEEPSNGYYYRRRVDAQLLTGETEWCWIYECNANKYKLDYPIVHLINGLMKKPS